VDAQTAAQTVSPSEEGMLGPALKLSRSKQPSWLNVPHISLAVTELSPESPKAGNTVTFTFWFSHAATAKVTGGLLLAVLQW
jgi:hypothetical protein